jgi:hypothetical protein
LQLIDLLAEVKLDVMTYLLHDNHLFVGWLFNVFCRFAQRSSHSRRGALPTIVRSKERD